MKTVVYLTYSVTLGLLISACSSSPEKENANSPPTPQLIQPAKRAAPPKEKDDDIVVKPISRLGTPASEELPADAAPVEPTPSVDYPKEPNVYLVEAKSKDASHPFYHDGNPMGFVLNGIQGRDVVIKRGQTLTFRVKTGVQHDFYIATSPAGWGAAVYTDGVSGHFTYDGDVTVDPGKETPPLLYYGCRNHKSMGGGIHVVNSDKEAKEKQAELDNARGERIAGASKKSAPNNPADENKLKQKIAYAEMLVQIKGASLSGDQKKVIQQNIAAAKKSQSSGDLGGGVTAIDNAINLINGKIAAAGPTEQELAEQKADFEALLLTARSFQDSHDASYTQAKKEKRKAVDYDRKQVEELFSEAEKLAKQKKYEEATKKVAKGERIVTVALNEMLGSQTLIYEVKFDTPKDEFEYEVKRYLSYAELVPIAITERKPNEQSVKLMQAFVDKAKFFHDKANESASKGNFPEAIAIIRDATIEVRRGLMTIGVSM